MDGRSKLSGTLQSMLITIKDPGPPVYIKEFTGVGFYIDGGKLDFLLEMLKDSAGKQFYAQILNNRTIVDLIEV